MNPKSKTGVQESKLVQQKGEKTEKGEIMDMYLKMRPENTKDGGVILLRVPKPEKGEILDVYLKLRREGTKDGGVLVRWDRPKKGKG